MRHLVAGRTGGLPRSSHPAQLRHDVGGAPSYSAVTFSPKQTLEYWQPRISPTRCLLGSPERRAVISAHADLSTAVSLDEPLPGPVSTRLPPHNAHLGDTLSLRSLSRWSVAWPAPGECGRSSGSTALIGADHLLQATLERPRHSPQHISSEGLNESAQ